MTGLEPGRDERTARMDQLRLEDEPEIRLHLPLRFPQLGVLLITGRTRQPTGAAELHVSFLASDPRRPLVTGVSPRSRSTVGIGARDLLYLDDGTFYGVLTSERLDDIREVRATTDFSPLVRRQVVHDVRWPDDIATLAATVAADGPGAPEARELYRRVQLQALAVAVLTWSRGRAGTDAPLADEQAVEVGEALRKNGLAALALPFVTAGVPRPLQEGESEAYAVRIELACDALGYHHDARALLAQELAANGESGWYHVCSGHVEWNAGNDALADQSYAYAARLYESAGVRGAHFDNGVFTWRSETTATALAAARGGGGPQLELPRTDVAGRRVVHLVACDDGYFRRWGNMLIYSSLRAGAEDVLVHVHVADPSEETVRTLEEWSARRDVVVRFSTEQLPPAHATVAMYTCLRFLVAPMVQAAYGLPMVISDVDMVVNRSWDDVIELVRPADVAYIDPGRSARITSRRGGSRPWALAAGSVYVGASGTGQAYLDFVSRYIRAVIGFPAPEVWYRMWSIDQVALGRGLEHIVLERGGTVLNLRLARFFRGPAMHAGGKATLLTEPAPSPGEVPVGEWPRLG